MTVGYPVDKSQVDGISGQLSRQIESWVPDVLKFKVWLDGAPDADLTDPDGVYRYTEQEVAILKSAFNDLALLARIYKGQDTLAEARDLSTFARQLAGLYI